MDVRSNENESEPGHESSSRAVCNAVITTPHHLSPLPVDGCVTQWYAAYTSANHEKSVANQLASRGVEHFLPLYDSIRKWKDRRVKIQLPLFSGYVFVRFAMHDKLNVLQIPGVACLVSFGGRAVSVPEEDLQRIRKLLNAGVAARPHLYLTVGKPVRVKSGPLKGFEGIIVKRKNATRFVLSIDLLRRSVTVDVDGMELESLPQYLTRTDTVVSHG